MPRQIDEGKTSWKKKLALLVVSSLIALAVIGLGELYCRWFTEINFRVHPISSFLPNRFGDSYGNRPNYTGVSYGAPILTDSNGFRVDELTSYGNDITDSRSILILGDSVSFGVGVVDELTVAGRLRQAMPNVPVHNVSSVGYDAFDYRNVVDTVLSRPHRIEKVLLFFCLNDVNEISAAGIRFEMDPSSKADQPLTHKIDEFLRSNSKLFIGLKNLVRDHQMMHFQSDLEVYRKGDQYVFGRLEPLIDIKRRLESEGIELKVYMLPYEAQLRPDTPQEYFLPQQMVADFLRQNGIESYDTTPEFQTVGAGASNLFLYDDPMHLSEQGNRLVAEFVCRKLPGCKL